MKNYQIGSCFLLGMSLFLVSGCSTIMHGSKEKVSIHSEPSGATVLVNGQEQKTPAVFNLPGKSGYDIIANKKGYKTAHAHIDSNFRVGSTIFGNILWLIPGLIVDIATGSAYELQDQVTIPMQKE